MEVCLLPVKVSKDTAKITSLLHDTGNIK